MILRLLLAACALVVCVPAHAQALTEAGVLERWRSSLVACRVGAGSDLQWVAVFKSEWPIPSDFLLLADSRPDLEWFAWAVPWVRETALVRSSRIFVIDRGAYEKNWSRSVLRSKLRFRAIEGLSVARGVLYDDFGLSKEFMVATDGATYLLLWGRVVQLHQSFFDCFAARKRAETGG